MRGCCSPTGWLPVARAAKPSLDLLIRWCHESGPVCLHWPWCLSELIFGKKQSVCAVGAVSHSLLQDAHPCLWSHFRKNTGLCKWSLELFGSCWGPVLMCNTTYQLPTSDSSSALPSAGRRRKTLSLLEVELREGGSWKAALAESCPECHSHGHAPLYPGWHLTNCLSKAQGVKSSVQASLGLQTGGRCWPLAINTALPYLSLWLFPALRSEAKEVKQQ